MANKYFRKNLNKGGGADTGKIGKIKSADRSPADRIKKLVKQLKEGRRLGEAAKKSSTGKGGGADTGKVGEMKSKLSVAGMKAKDIMGKSKPGLTKKQIEKLKELFDRNKNKFGPKGNPEKFMIPLKKGGRATLKKGSKFPDHSGDGKITQKDILMAKGVIPKKKNKKKVI